ncbi:helical backbone metal receptor [Alicyclobacillus tolerans]|uniref:helical backbone metal receptor n=1 Tax=Alicyclobacillus tolerans TaxID=90970 RepID=UPI001F444B1A|nr:helical backbone metal receptor [Alicyclobacillus tolerans]MCF8566550.1 helical backbone metal receptor [Alicyclobacillus tolerans]
MAFPERIVCLAAEVPEILFRLGALDKVVGISAYTTRPKEALDIQKVSGFKFGSPERIMSLKPDLVVLTSGVQKELAAQLAAKGATLVHFNPHRLEDLYSSIQLLGNLVNKPREADRLSAQIQTEISEIKAMSKTLPERPKVYFEEWMDPIICGTGWVSDLIEIAGGQDVFREKSIRGRSASERTVSIEEIVGAAPDVVLASWCGKPFENSSFLARNGFESIPAVQYSKVYEVSGEILQFGPMLIDRLKDLSKLFREVALEKVQRTRG